MARMTKRQSAHEQSACQRPDIRPTDMYYVPLRINSMHKVESQTNCIFTLIVLNVTLY